MLPAPPTLPPWLTSHDLLSAALALPVAVALTLFRLAWWRLPRSAGITGQTRRTACARRRKSKVRIGEPAFIVAAGRVAGLLIVVTMLGGRVASLRRTVPPLMFRLLPPTMLRLLTLITQTALPVVRVPPVPIAAAGLACLAPVALPPVPPFAVAANGPRRVALGVSVLASDRPRCNAAVRQTSNARARGSRGVAPSGRPRW